jgi:hypothetical protein
MYADEIMQPMVYQSIYRAICMFQFIRQEGDFVHNSAHVLYKKSDLFCQEVNFAL